MAPLEDAALQSFVVASDPVQFWEIEYDGSFSGCPSATFPDCVALTFHYDDQSLLDAETELEISHREDGVWVTLEKTGQDLVNNTITVVTTSFSPFVLSTSASPTSSLTLTGTAQGGSIEVAVGDVFLGVATSAGQTAEQVAAAVAAAINANFTLMDAGITATADGALVSTNGSITAIRIEDPGFLPSPPTIPALGPLALLACVLALWAAGLTGLRRRNSTR